MLAERDADDDDDDEDNIYNDDDNEDDDNSTTCDSGVGCNRGSLHFLLLGTAH